MNAVVMPRATSSETNRRMVFTRFWGAVVVVAALFVTEVAMLGSVSAAFKQCRLVISSHAGLCHLVCCGGRLGPRLPPGAVPSQSRTSRAYGLFRLLLLSYRPALPQTRAKTD